MTNGAGICIDLPHQCGHCGCWHTGTCPRIKRIEYYPDGTPKAVEYHGDPVAPSFTPQPIPGGPIFRTSPVPMIEPSFPFQPPQFYQQHWPQVVC
jgi:hypothetical protein